MADLVSILIFGGILVATAIAAIALAAIWAGIIGSALYGLACVGWIPILICAVSEKYEIGVHFTGTLAYWAMWLYALLSTIIVILGFTVRDEDKIPPGFKFLALFWRHRAETMSLAESPQQYVAAVGHVPTGRAWTRVEANRFNDMADRAEAETEHRKAAARVLQAENDLARAKALEAELRKRNRRG